MYEVSLAETWERFGGHLDGAYPCPVLVVSSTPLPDNARNALESSVAALGYGKNACTFLVVGPARKSEDAGASLSDAELFAAIEGLDSLAMILADRAAVSACSQAYRCEISTPDKNRMLGRDVVAFDDFAALLDKPQDKQRAWGLLKRLPRLES